MRTLIVVVTTMVVTFVMGRLSAQDVQPSCGMCPSTYVPAAEIQEYAEVGRSSGLVDQ